MRSGEICGLMAEDITAKGNLGRFISIQAQPGALAEVQGSRAGGATAWYPGKPAGYCTTDLRTAVPSPQRGQGRQALRSPAPPLS